jgi:hypothetical protein
LLQSSKLATLPCQMQAFAQGVKRRTNIVRGSRAFLPTDPSPLPQSLQSLLTIELTGTSMLKTRFRAPDLSTRKAIVAFRMICRTFRIYFPFSGRNLGAKIPRRRYRFSVHITQQQSDPSTRAFDPLVAWLGEGNRRNYATAAGFRLPTKAPVFGM